MDRGCDLEILPASQFKCPVIMICQICRKVAGIGYKMYSSVEVSDWQSQHGNFLEGLVSVGSANKAHIVRIIDYLCNIS